MNYGKHIRDLREELNLTQEEFADNIGVTQKHISTLERGLKRPSVELIEKIVDIYNVPVSRIFYGKVSTA